MLSLQQPLEGIVVAFRLGFGYRLVARGGRRRRGGWKRRNAHSNVSSVNALEASHPAESGINLFQGFVNVVLQKLECFAHASVGEAADLEAQYHPERHQGEQEAAYG